MLTKQVNMFFFYNSLAKHAHIKEPKKFPT